MHGGILIEVVLPLSLFIIMFGMGLSLSTADFARVVRYPRAVVIGLAAQIVLLPLIGFAIVKAFNMEPLLAVGLMILAFCPSGATANMYSYLFKGDVALSLTLTAIISVIKPFTLPLLSYYAMLVILGEGRVIELPIPRTMAQLFVITVLPVVLGMLLRKFKPGAARVTEKPVKIFSMIVLFLIIGGLVKENWSSMYGYFAQSGGAALALNIVSIAAGFGISRLLRLAKDQSITIAFELGIQNGTTALLVTGTILKVPEMTIVPITYSLMMFLTALGFGLWVARASRQGAAASTPSVVPE